MICADPPGEMLGKRLVAAGIIFAESFEQTRSPIWLSLSRHSWEKALSSGRMT